MNPNFWRGGMVASGVAAFVNLVLWLLLHYYGTFWAGIILLGLGIFGGVSYWRYRKSQDWLSDTILFQYDASGLMKENYIEPADDGAVLLKFYREDGAREVRKHKSPLAIPLSNGRYQRTFWNAKGSDMCDDPAELSGKKEGITMQAMKMAEHKEIDESILRGMMSGSHLTPKFGLVVIALIIGAALGVILDPGFFHSFIAHTTATPPPPTNSTTPVHAAIAQIRMLIAQ